MIVKRERRDDGNGAREIDGERRNINRRVRGNEEEMKDGTVTRENGLIGRLKRYGTRTSEQ